MRTALIPPASTSIQPRKARPGYGTLITDFNSFGGWMTFPIQSDPFFARWPKFASNTWAGYQWDQLYAGAPGAQLKAQLVAAQPYAAVIGFETTNSIFNQGQTTPACLSALSSWAAFVRAYAPNAPILVMGCPPRYQAMASGGLATYGSGDAGVSAAMTAMFAVDSALAASPATYGIDGFVNIRQAVNGVTSPYGFADSGGTGTVISVAGTTWSTVFAAHAAAYRDTYVHPSDSAIAFLVGALSYTFQAMQ